MGCCSEQGHLDHAAARVGGVDLLPEAVWDGRLTVRPNPSRTQAWRGGRVFGGLCVGSRLPRFVLERLRLLRLLHLLRLCLLRLLSGLPLFRLARLGELLLLRGAHHK